MSAARPGAAVDGGVARDVGSSPGCGQTTARGSAQAQPMPARDGLSGRRLSSSGHASTQEKRREGGRSMKIRDAKTYVVANPPPHHGGPYFVLVKLTTDDNIRGFGEVYGAPFAPDNVVHLIDDVVDQHVIGWNPFQTEKLWRIVYS